MGGSGEVIVIGQTDGELFMAARIKEVDTVPSRMMKIGMRREKNFGGSLDSVGSRLASGCASTARSQRIAFEAMRLVEGDFDMLFPFRRGGLGIDQSR